MRATAHVARPVARDEAQAGAVESGVVLPVEAGVLYTVAESQSG